MDNFGFRERIICEKLRYSGIAVLNVSLAFPEYGFLSEIAENAHEWSKKTLFESVCREYDSDSDPKKRFFFGYDYSFFCKMCFCDDGIISAKIRVLLKERNKRTVVAKNEFGVVVRERDSAILPIEAMADKKTVKKYRKSGGESFFVDNRGIIMLSNDGRESLLCENIANVWSF